MNSQFECFESVAIEYKGTSSSISAQLTDSWIKGSRAPIMTTRMVE